MRVLEGDMLAGRDKGVVLALLGFLCGEERLWQWAEWPGGGWVVTQSNAKVVRLESVGIHWAFILGIPETLENSFKSEWLDRETSQLLGNVARLTPGPEA